MIPRNKVGRKSDLERRHERWREWADDRMAGQTVAAGHAWPSTEYQTDPVRFAGDVLGVKLWQRQREILEAMCSHKRVAVSSGHKVSKSHTAAIAALWFFCSFPDARVVLTSTTSRQVDQILWREVRMLRARARVAIDGDMHELARSGLRADFREIVGFTAREAEAVAGVSGPNLLYIADEATGIDDAIFEAIEGNRAGGARLLMFSNPTRTDGEFARAFLDESKKRFFRTFEISSEEVVDLGIPGLATREWVEEKRAEWGVDSPLYKVRVQGKFVLGEDGKVLSLHAIGQAEERWHEIEGDGRLTVGLDVAGDGDTGDEIVWAMRRGPKILSLVAQRSLSEAAIVAHTMGVLREHRHPREVPVVLIDREGAIGSRVYGLLRSHADTNPNALEVYGVRSSERAYREPAIYDRVRDELWANLRQWVREGGAIPEDAKLAQELHAPAWYSDLRGRQKITDKKMLRKILQRSPDRADAVALSVWEPIALQADRDITPEREAAEDAPDSAPDPDRVFDPYAGL